MKIRKCTAVFLSLLMTFSMLAFLPILKVAAVSMPILNYYVPITKATSVTLTGTADAGDTVTIKGGSKIATGKVTSSGTFSISVTLNLNCTNTLKLTANNSSGNVSYPEQTAVIVQDSQKPVTPTILTSAQTTSLTSIVVSGTAEPSTTMTIKGGLSTIIDSASSTGAFNFTVTLKKNVVNSISVTSTDYAGNVSSAATVKITQKTPTASDTTPPAKPSLTTKAQYTSSRNITVEGTAEANSTVKVTGGYGYGTYIGTASYNGSFSIAVQLFENAVNTLSVTSTDSTGNVSTAATVKITQDDVVPDVPTIGIDAQTTVSTSITLTGMAEASSTVTISGGAKTVTVTASSAGVYKAAIPLNTNSVNILVVKATDRAGNVSDAVTVNITQESPTNAPTLTTPSQITTSTSITVTGFAEAGSTVSITGGLELETGTVDGSGAFSMDVPLNTGVVNTLYVMATSSDNIMSPAVTLAITQEDDSSIPTITTESQTTTSTIITIRGRASVDSFVRITGGLEEASGTADSKGNYSINVNLIQNYVNTLSVTATDTDGKTSSPNTVVITQGTGVTTSGKIGFSITTDTKFTNDGSGKYFNATVTQTSGTTLSSWALDVVTTNSDGSQTAASTTYKGNQSAIKVYVSGDAAKSSVYVSNESFDNVSIPVTYSLTKFVKI